VVSSLVPKFEFDTKILKSQRPSTLTMESHPTRYFSECVPARA
jgi:hypothetical protein